MKLSHSETSPNGHFKVKTLCTADMSSPPSASDVASALPQGEPPSLRSIELNRLEALSLIYRLGAGYGILIGVGAAFAFGMWGLSILLAKFQNEVQGSEMFMTAKRSINTGLVASAVVSGWTIGIHFYLI